MSDYDAAIEIRDAICSLITELTLLRRMMGLGVLVLSDNTPSEQVPILYDKLSSLIPED